MSEFVNKEQGGAAEESGVEIELGELRPFMVDEFEWEDFGALELGFGFGAAMGFDVADHNIYTGLSLRVRRLEHGVRFPDAGGRTEEDFETTASLLRGLGLDASEEFIGIGTLV